MSDVQPSHPLIKMMNKHAESSINHSAFIRGASVAFHLEDGVNKRAMLISGVWKRKEVAV